ncbi:MAG: NADH-quinone oxidoreductase subunit M [Acidobacteriota bacterium]|nr:NADH-quinone oxidoreductase subunit M [Acidobacteriota bacterium]
MNPLDILLLVPLAGFLATLVLPKSGAGPIRVFAFITSLVAFAMSVGIAIGYKSGVPGQQFVTDFVWIPNPEIHYHVGIDGISLWLVVLSTFLTPIAILLSWHSVQKNVKSFFALLLLLEFGLVGVFSALDLLVYYGFWELTLVPMYLFIGSWGGERRIYAALKFFIYTFAGSILMLAAIIFLANRAGTTNYSTVLDMIANGKLALSSTEELTLFLAFFLAFAIKLALFPLHTWLPDSYNAAPAAAAIMLAAVMAKMGTYSILRFCLPFFPSASRRCAPWIVILAIITIIYGALVALVQPNIKRLVAYSSMSHIGFVVLGIFSFTQLGLDGAVYQMLSHGVTTGALFLLIGFLEQRRGTTQIADYGGLAAVAPWFSTAFLIATLASIGLPILNNFVGEFLVLQGTAQAYFPWAAWAALGIILSACYMLWMYQRVFYGEARELIPDLNLREWACILPLVAMMFWMGIYTQTFLPAISTTNTQILDQSRNNVPLRVRTEQAVPHEVASVR